ncbi:DUF6802 family protein [Rhodococcus xishaensis]|uniref:DUF6802 domain-containing protein n=1 Tax=Rhodococcus xishaensis TaxID=2487364 RepID=A0A438ARM4_9NOCA|nr:DUF6802 family protein [Rhodococcus xishaensis]RVW01350.1 hypothetical protein EGT50_14160 [Rhodococcus xishaensis]
MITTDEFTADQPEIDPDDFGTESGTVELAGPAYDIDGDGILDTRTYEVDDAMIVATDTDGDGDADHLTIVDSGGEYSAWEFHRDADGRERWERIDEGGLGR